MTESVQEFSCMIPAVTIPNVTSGCTATRGADASNTSQSEIAVALMRHAVDRECASLRLLSLLTGSASLSSQCRMILLFYQSTKWI